MVQPLEWKSFEKSLVCTSPVVGFPALGFFHSCSPGIQHPQEGVRQLKLSVWTVKDKRMKERDTSLSCLC